MPTGFSEAAETLARVRDYEAKRRDETVTFSKQPLYDQLIDVFVQSSQAGWEGEDSDAVDRGTLMIAKQIVESLPMVYRTPAITGEPDGHINLEWYVHPRRILTVSINPNGILHWAALIGAEDPRGSCPFYGEMPRTLLYWIGRVCIG
jgi:hypothetical protein